MAVVVAGCAAPRYQDSYEKNVAVTVKLGDDGLFTSTEVSLGVNDLAADCSSVYRGYVPLSAGRTEIGLTPAQQTYLLVEIEQSKFREKSSFSRGTLLTPKKGKKYEMDVTYVDEMLDLRVYEVAGTVKKRLEIVPASNCRPKTSRAGDRRDHQSQTTVAR